MTELRIGSRRIGPGEPVYVIAELSANHHQEFDEAVRLVHAARIAGADAVKLQTYTPATITLDCDSSEFRLGAGTLWAGRRLYDLYREACTPWEWQPRLLDAAHEIGLELFSTPFDDSAVDFLEAMGVGAYKIASFEIVDLGLIERVARTGKPVIMSTGMATLPEIAEAMRTARDAGAEEVALLKCTSAYPAPPDEMHLRTIPDLAAAFQVPVGLSDHTLGGEVAVAAVALGACIVEKHFTLSRSRPGPDSAFSLEPSEFRAMVDAIRVVERALGEVHYGPANRERASLVFRRSLFAVEDIAPGEPFTRRNVRSIRPGTGLAPKHLGALLGRYAAVAVPRGTPLRWEHVADG
jgi:N-acetylneuraminate synthase